ncbi:Retrovirus-related Pol polyprotein [Stylophora pistillata]|uniref:Retrovirus-related Pol polyprotein n=1 Tax=Stylophora pistillata TaxID=50429 RepID=A0A2B4REF1_STYPI|nr:Retrovirus-related Pol polyprotein [Stylophora pistillata]
MGMAQFHLPPKLDLTDGNLADAFRKWKRQLEVYMEASGTTNKPKQRQTAIILYCAGPQVLEVYDHFQVDEEDDKTIQRKFLKSLDLKKAIEICGAFEITSRNTKEMNASSEAQKIDKLSLGLKTVQEMGLFTINVNNFIAQVTSNGNLLGNLGESELHVDPDIPPRALPCHKLPIALQEDVKQELDRLVDIGILIPVEEPSVWVSQMAVVKKPDGSLRICIDPQPLNEALQREHYRLTTLDDVLPNLNNAKRKLNEALCGLSGVICVADDPLVMGSGNTREEADADHEQNLREVQKRCTERNIKLNDEKSVIKQTQIKFMGHLITNEGVHADKFKVDAILNMPAPTDVQEHYRHPVLAYFDPDKELVLQVDGSKEGLGAALLQDGKPIKYASRALTSAERNWAQIEKESLAVVFGLERFDQYTYGRKVIVQNDHKSLASILKKPLSQAPKRLQALILRLHRYVDFHYIEGNKLFIADTLSRAYLDVPDSHIRVMRVNALKGESDERIKEVKEATAEDENMQTLLGIIKDGWPKHKNDVPSELRPHFDVRDTLSHQDGIILKGERIVILKSLRDIMKKTLHAAHRGYDS